MLYLFFNQSALTNRFTTSLIPAISWLMLVTFLHCLPGKEFPSVNWLSGIWFDKWVHTGLFLVLVILCCRYQSFKNYSKEKLAGKFFIISVLSLLYGVFLEIIQHYFIPLRAFEGGDILADAAGSLAGYLLSVRWFKKN